MRRRCNRDRDDSVMPPILTGRIFRGAAHRRKETECSRRSPQAVERWIAVVGFAVFLNGCASKQLNFNTQDIAGSVSDFYMNEALDNFGRLISNPYAVPSQVDILVGTAQTSNSITPNLTFPLTHMFASAVGSTTSRTTTIAGASMGIMAADAWQQNWNITTISDANQLRNLQALYRHEIIAGSDITTEYIVPVHYDYNASLVEDPFFRIPPHCVLCVPMDRQQDPKAKKALNPDLEDPGWLFWQLPDGSFSSKTMTLPANTVDMRSLGAHSGYALYIRERDLPKLSKFLFFILPVTEPTPPSGAKPPPPPEHGGVAPKKGSAPATAPLGGGPAANPRMMPFGLVPYGIQPQAQ